MPRSKLPIIRASEVGEFVYCARSWWLKRVAGLEPDRQERRAAGVVHHTAHGQAVVGSRLLLWLAILLALIALLGLLLA